MEKAYKNELAEKAMKTVDIIIANTIKRFNNMVDQEEIRSYALKGLAEAINRFDPKRNVSIGAYATSRIKGAIYDGLISNTMLPRKVARQVVFYNKCDDMMSFKARMPAPSDKTEATHRMASNLREITMAYVTTAACTDKDTEAIEDNRPELNAEECLLRKEYTQKIVSAIEQLPEKQKMLVINFFYKDMSLSEIARELGHTPSWASRSLNSAMVKLRRIFQHHRYRESKNHHSTVP